MLHAADVEALQAAKEQVSKNAAVRQQLEEAAQKAESALLECKASWEERERMLKVDFLFSFSISSDCFELCRCLWFSNPCTVGKHSHIFCCRMKCQNLSLAVKT